MDTAWIALALTLKVAGWATALNLVLGVGIGYAMSRRRFAGRDVLDAAFTLPMVLPPTVLGYYLLGLIGRESAVGRAWEALTGAPLVFTPTAAVLAATLAAFPFVVKTARAAMEDVDPRLLGAAATLGASPWRAFVTVLLPLSRGGIVAGLSLGFARALGDFGVTLMIAGNIPGLTQTASLAVYDAVQANREAQAAGLVAVMTAIAVAALYAGARLTRRRPHAW